MKEILKIIIPIVAPSLNSFYAGIHWTTRKAIADLWHQSIKAEVLNKRIKTLPVRFYPLTIKTQTFTKSKRKRDTVNCVMANKLTEDGLVYNKVIPGDTVEYVDCHIVCVPVFGHERNETVIILETEVSG